MRLKRSHGHIFSMTLRNFVHDGRVPYEYLLYGQPCPFKDQSPTPLEIQVVASYGTGMGHSSRPNKVQGWEGIFTGQTTYNGGGSRVPLDWSPGMPIDFTRKTIPIETVRIASLCSQYK